jgi:hypothetical protein
VCSYNEPTGCTNFYFISVPRLYMLRAIFSPSSRGQVCNVAVVIFLRIKRLSAGLDEKELISSRPADSRCKSKRNTIATLYNWPPDDGLTIARNMYRRGNGIK